MFVLFKQWDRLEWAVGLLSGIVGKALISYEINSDQRAVIWLILTMVFGLR